jgi:hypothetical protein
MNGKPRAAGQRRTGLAWFAGLVALSACAGALGLAFGFLDLGTQVTARLPFGSPVLGGLALAVIVAVPSTVLARWAWRGDPRTDLAAVVTGVLVIGWIVVELAFIKELSFFHPTYVVVGAALIWAGRRSLHRTTTASV